MICPKCGTTNGDTNKYCRECGHRLDYVSADAVGDGGPRHDEVGLGQELFKVWQLFEAGQLDAALDAGVKIARSNFESASAHSLVALIYERKADDELGQGNAARGHQLLKRAIDHYERIIDLNPDSSADREKLASLRMKVAGQATRKPKKLAGFRAALKAVPPPWLAAFGAFLAILMLAIILIPGGGDSVDIGSVRAQSKPGELRMAGTQSVPTAPPARPLSVYTFPAPPQAAPVRVPTPPEAKVPPKPPKVVKPAPLPALPELSIVAEPRKPDGEEKVGDAPEAEAGPTGSEPSGEEANPAPAGPTGSTLLAEAIRLHDQGKDQEAIGAAQQAIALYQADIDAGTNVAAAKRGIDNAKKLTTVWQQSVAVSTQEQ